MGQTSAIEWTDATWNPVRGCSRVSPGCVNCYAERQAARFAKDSLDPQGSGPFAGFVHKVNGHPAWTGKVELVEKHLTDPLHWKQPKRIFVNSMSDLFHEALPDETIDRAFAVMALCPQHAFQILTKRPERMLEWASRKFVDGDVQVHANDLRDRHRIAWPVQLAALAGRISWDHAHGLEKSGDALIITDTAVWPLPNVWLGVSVEDQQRADERIPLLLQTPAAVRFVSYEPALGPVDFGDYLGHHLGCCWGPVGDCDCDTKGRLDWIIVGGESGPGARPFDLGWARETIAQCKAANVACFVKQLGAKPYKFEGYQHLKLFQHPKGGDWSEWPEDLRVRQFPIIGAIR